MKFHSGVEWTPELVEAFEVMLQDKNSSYQTIATALSLRFNISLTKNACVGKGRRLGVANRRPTRPSYKKTKPPRSTYKVRPLVLPVRDIYQLEAGYCKWPLAKVQDHPPYQYCGQPTELGRSWCAAHQKMSLRKVG